jgi:hypothetical protein
MLVDLLILILVLGLILWLVRTLLPEPFQTAATVVCVVILILWLLRFAGYGGALLR